MTVDTQAELLQIINRYKETDYTTIKYNLKRYMDLSTLSLTEISEHTKIKLQTLYQIRKVHVPYNVDFILAMRICDAIQITIDKLLSPVDIVKPEKLTKWSITAKQKYIQDFEKMSITKVCEVYKILQRTAHEYYRVFSIELKELTELETQNML